MSFYVCNRERVFVPKSKKLYNIGFAKYEAPENSLNLIDLLTFDLALCDLLTFGSCFAILTPARVVVLLFGATG